MARPRPFGPLFYDGLVAQVLAFPPLRPAAVERGREVLTSPVPCPAREIAAELVDCLVGQRLP